MPDYKARAVESAFGTSDNGNEQIAVKFRVTEGDKKDYTFTWYGFFTEKTEERTMVSLKHCGWKSLDILDCADVSVLSNEVIIVVEKDEYQGKTRDVVKWVNSIEDGGLRIKNRLEGNSLKSFSARLKARALEVQGLTASKSETSKSSSAPPPDADDGEIPF